MKLLRLTSVYPGYARQFYAARPDIAARPYEEQAQEFFDDGFAWADSWKFALSPIGYECREIVANLEPMQRAWARENLPASAAANLKLITVEQVRQFRPDVLWFDDHDAELLRCIRSSVPGIRLVLGWTGSALPELNGFDSCDVVLSCSRESVERLTQAGHRAVELHHGFDPRILTRLRPCEELHDLIFIGQLIRGRGFHVGREKLLEELVADLPVEIFSPKAQSSWGTDLKRLMKRHFVSIYRLAKSRGAERTARRLLASLGKGDDWLDAPEPVVNPKLGPHISDGIYGLRMYQTICDAKITLNIHADSSDRYASNMRLFEVTGVGGCLLTDWKPNLPELFVPDEEVVTYRSTEECVEKAKWLIANRPARQAIARRGQARTLGQYTFAHRAPQLDRIIQDGIRSRLAPPMS